jgi:hypothetical protein
VLPLIVGQATAKGQTFEISIQAYALCRIIRRQEPKRLASSTTNVQYSGIPTEISSFKDGRLKAIICGLATVFSRVVVQFLTQFRRSASAVYKALCLQFGHTN